MAPFAWLRYPAPPGPILGIYIELQLPSADNRDIARCCPGIAAPFADNNRLARGPRAKKP